MLLYEVLFNEESMDYFEAQKHLYPLVWDVKMVLKAISECDIQELQGILNIAEKFHSDTKYDEKHEAMEEKLQKIWNFIKNFYKCFSEIINESVFNIPANIDYILAENIIRLIVQDKQLGCEESLAILHCLRPIVCRLPTGGHELMANMYFTGLNICEMHNVFGKQFAIIISSNDNWSIDQFIRGCNPRLDNIVKNGLFSILRSKAEIRRLDDDLKKDLKRAYKALVEKGYKFSLIERYRALCL